MVDCCSAPGLMPLAEAKNTLLASVTAVTETEKVSLIEADKRIVAQAIFSPLNVPAHNNSAMDGYALAASANAENTIRDNSSFTLVGVAMAGQPFMGELKTGQCIRIMTGAVVPDSANAVEMQENVTVSGDIVTLTQASKIGNHIRLAGEDIKAGQLVFSKGHQLSSIDVGLLASLGVPTVDVFRKVRVAVFSTGDELKSPGEALNTGDIYESNRHALIAMLNRLSIDVIDLGIIADDKTKISAAFEQANKQADAVMSSGGVSVGDADYTKEVLDELGNIAFWKIAMKPGKPFAFGQLANSVFFGLPGNPVSATVTFHQLAVPALKKISGMVVKEPMTFKVMSSHAIKKRPGRMDFQRGFLTVNNSGVMTVKPLSHQGSGVLSSMSQANCYIVLSQEHAGCDAGDIVDVQLFDGIIS